MIRADIAIGVWWRTSTELGCSTALKGQYRRRHRSRRTPHIFEQLLDVREARNAVICCMPCSVRIAREHLLVELLLLRDIRKISQVLGQKDRTDHSCHLRSLCTGGVLRVVGPIVLLAGLCAISLGEQRHSDAEKAKRRSS